MEDWVRENAVNYNNLVFWAMAPTDSRMQLGVASERDKSANGRKEHTNGIVPRRHAAFTIGDAIAHCSRSAGPSADASCRPFQRGTAAELCAYQPDRDVVLEITT